MHEVAGNKTQEVSQKMESCLDLLRASVSSIESARDSFEGIQLSVNEIRDQNHRQKTAMVAAVRCDGKFMAMLGLEGALSSRLVKA